MSKRLLVGRDVEIGLEEIVEFAFDKEVSLELSEGTLEAVEKSYRELMNRLGEEPIYGISTGFGELANSLISREQADRLQANLIYSHAVGSGNAVNPLIVRIASVLRLHSLAKGFSGVSPELISYMLGFISSGLVPIVPEYGSVGASGDLIPLAHIALAMLGEGKVLFEGDVVDADVALERKGLKPYKLKPKEGLALINGTCFSSAIMSYGVYILRRAIYYSHVATAMGLVALLGLKKHFDIRLAEVKPQKKLAESISLLNSLLEGVSWRESNVVQEPYTYRCAPYVLATAWSRLEFAEESLRLENNSVTDNPIVYGGDVISGGNFHGNDLSVAADTLRIVLAQLGDISFHRISRLLDSKLNRGLPPYLADNPGLNSGYMISHYLMSSLAAELKALASPLSVYNLPVSGGQEDVVTYSQSSAAALIRSLDRYLRLLAGELLIATHALRLRIEGGKVQLGRGKLYEIYQKLLPLLKGRREDMDEPLYKVHSRFETWLMNEVGYTGWLLSDYLKLGR